MQPINRRKWLGLCAGGGLGALPMLGAGSAAAQGWMPNPFARRDEDPFATLLTELSGVTAASTTQFATPLPDGETLLVRATLPASPPERMGLLLLVPDTGVDPVRYDLLATGIASQGYLVLSPVCHTVATDTAAQREHRRVAECRLILDRILAVRSVLGASAERLDPNRIGSIGHGDGAWTALGLIGWGRGLRPDATASDGRVSAAVGLLPGQVAPARIDSQAVDRVSGQGLVVGRIDALPIPPEGSGLWGVSLHPDSPNFGGLIGAQGRARADDARRERPALTAAMAVSTLYLDWVLKEKTESGRALAALDGRAVEGLVRPLAVRKA